MKKIILCVLSLLFISLVNGSIRAMGNTMENYHSDVNTIPITPDIVVLEEGETQQLSLKNVNLNYYSSNLIWTSSNVAVATVNETGLVTAVGEGSATVTCTLKKVESPYFNDSSYNPPSFGSCSVTVNKKIVVPQNIVFADAEVKRICVKNWDTNGDGELSYEEASDVTDLGRLFKDNKSITSFNELTYFTGLTSIGEGAFAYCSNLTSVNIPNSVKTLGNSVFQNCSNLASVTIPNSVTEIGTLAFYYCEALSSVAIPNSMTAIGTKAFTHCFGLTSITIPNSVTSIGDYAFDRCQNLTSITIPNSVTSIGSCAFYGCEELNTVTIPNSVTSIGAAAFAGCRNLTAFNLPNSITSIGKLAFENCTKLTSVTIPKSVTSIGEHPFYNCPALETIVVESGNTKFDSRDNSNAVIETASNTLIIGCKNTTIPNSVKVIGEGAFGKCKSLSSLAIPNSVTSIGVLAFSLCENLSSVTIPNSVTSIGNSAFMDCKSLASVTIPNSITSIGNAVFYGCSSLTSVTIPNSVTSIEAYAFLGCNGLTSVNIPNSMNSIGFMAFSGCGNLNSVTVEARDPLSIQEEVFSNSANATLYVPKGTKSAYETANYWKEFKEIVEMESEASDAVDFADAEVKRICVENWDSNGDRELSFDEATAVTDLGQVFKSNSVITSFEELKYFTRLTKISESAFQSCINLSSINLPTTIKVIKNCAFEHCLKLQQISLHEGIESIDWGAFMACNSLTTIMLPSTLTKLGFDDEGYSYNPFANCNALSNISVVAGNPIYDSRGNCNAIIATATNTLIVGCNNTTIPSDVVKLGNLAFSGCKTIESVAFPSSIKTLGNQVFGDCSNLKSIDLGKVENIGYACFSNPLKSVYIPATVIQMDWANTFASIYGTLETITVDDGNPYYDSRDNCNAIIAKNFANTTLRDGKKAENVLVTGCKNTIIPNSVRAIGMSAFKYCKMSGIDIPEGVESILRSAFQGSEIQSITLPKSLSFLDEAVFYRCNNLTSVTVQNEAPLSIDETTFSNRANTTLYVPHGCKDAYEAADYWKEFKQIVEMDSNEPGQIEVTDVSQMSNAIYIEPFAANIGDEAEIEVKVKNADAIISYGFELVLPEGMNIAVDGNGAFDNSLTLSSRNSEHMVMTNKLSENVYKVAVVSLSSKSLTDHDGLVLTVNAHVADDMGLGTYVVKVQNPLIVNKDFTKPAVQETVTSVNIEESTTGDTDVSALDNVVYINKVEGFVGQQKTLSLKMKNTVGIQTVQFDLYLPDGVTVAKDEDGFDLIELSTERTTVRKMDSFSSRQISDGTYRVLINSSGGYTFDGEDGEVARVTVNIADDIAEGDYPLILKDIVLVNKSSEGFETEYVKATLTVSDYSPGDVNSDGKVNAIDLNAIVNYILESRTFPFTFVEKAADLNGDRKINAIDVNMVTNMILGSFSPKGVKAQMPIYVGVLEER